MREPVGESIQPRSLVAEGSNYTRPLRMGFGIWGFVQADYVHNQISENQLDPDGHSLNQNQFGLRRGRLRLDHGFKYAFAALELEAGTFGGAHVGIRRAEASLLYRADIPDSITPPIVLSAGVTDVPFGAELGESQRDRVFMERSIGSTALFPSTADIGAKLWGAYGSVSYALAVVNGEPISQDGLHGDPNAAKDVAGRVGVTHDLNERFGVSGGLSFYTGKGFSAGTVASSDSITWVDVNNNGITEPEEIQGVTASTALPSESYSRWAVGFDAGLAWKSAIGFTQLATEGFYASNLDRGVLPTDPVVTGADARQLGWMASLVQQVTGWAAVGFRGAFYDPNSNLMEQRAGEFHLKDQTFWVLSPVAAFTLDQARFSLQYDVVIDHMGRDSRGVPSNVKNDQFSMRLQVDL